MRPIEITDEPVESNPFLLPGIDDVVEKQISQDIWLEMLGELPCAVVTRPCISQLQQMAIANSRLLQDLGGQVEEANRRIEEAERNNQDSVSRAVFSPFLQSFLSPTFNQGKTPNPLAIILGNLGSGLIGSGLSALFNWSSIGANDAQVSQAIAINDLRVKTAELERSQLQAVDVLKARVELEVLKLEEVTRAFQLEKDIALRERQRLEISKVGFTFGEGDSRAYLAQLSSYDRQKASAGREWSRLRSQLVVMKSLVLAQ